MADGFTDVILPTNPVLLIGLSMAGISYGKWVKWTWKLQLIVLALSLGMLFFGNLWLFGPLLKLVMPMVSAQASAMLQTTIAFTMAKGSDGYNIIPQEAYVTANMRFIPHQKVKESLQVLETLAAKYDLELENLGCNDPSSSLDLQGRASRLTEKAIERPFPGLPASPYVVTGATDCRFYNDVCDNCVRFSPIIMGPAQMKGMHGIDENLETNCLPGAVDFYKNIIRLQEEM